MCQPATRGPGRVCSSVPNKSPISISISLELLWACPCICMSDWTEAFSLPTYPSVLLDGASDQSETVRFQCALCSVSSCTLWVLMLVCCDFDSDVNRVTDWLSWKCEANILQMCTVNGTKQLRLGCHGGESSGPPHLWGCLRRAGCVVGCFDDSALAFFPSVERVGFPFYSSRLL